MLPLNPRRAAAFVPSSLPTFAALLLAACAPAAAPSTSPTPARPPVVVSAPSPTPATASARGSVPARTVAPANWHRLDLEQDGVLGVGSDRALRELLASRTPARRVIVAVIDGGIDTAHALLAPVLWRNARETAGNRTDDDGNGFVDDVTGWNFAGAVSGQSVGHDTFEMTRVYAACRGLPAGRGTPKPAAGTCTAVAGAYARKRQEIAGTVAQIAGLSTALDRATGVLRTALGTDSVVAARVRSLAPSSPTVAEARQTWLQLTESGIDAKELAEARKAYDSQLTFGLDTMFDPRRAIGNDSATLARRGYGNRDVTGPDAGHGTHVAGIIGARRNADGSVQGIAPQVTIMALRAVPDGDERDDDVANAIRYAADNGANIVNMSFGKGYSPRKASVDSAVRYAEAKGVLFVHAAGNDGEDIDAVPSFPSAAFLESGGARSWLEVGASSWKGGNAIPATFSNFAKSRVDLFAPGVDILSTIPGGGVEPESGTSMAAPVVSGVAALLMSYFPNLTASDVKSLLVESVRPLGETLVLAPGDSGGRVKFSSLSRTGGVVDAYEAVKRALAREIKP